MRKTTLILLSVFLLLSLLAGCTHIDPLAEMTGTVCDEPTAAPVEGFDLPQSFFDEMTPDGHLETKDLVFCGNEAYCKKRVALKPTSPTSNVVTMAKIDLETGEVSAVCPDPLCSHDINKSNCIFKTGFYVKDVLDGVIYYTGCYTSKELGLRADQYTVADIGADKAYRHPIYAYDMKTGKRTLLFDTHSDYFDAICNALFKITDSKIYFLDKTFEEDELSLIAHFHIKSYDKKTGEIEDLLTYNSVSYDSGKGWNYSAGTGMNPFGFDVDRGMIYFSVSRAFSVDIFKEDFSTYSVSIKHGPTNEKPKLVFDGLLGQICSDGKLLFVQARLNDDIVTRSIVLFDPATGEQKDLINGISHYSTAYCGDWILTVKTAEKGVLRIINAKTCEEKTLPLSNVFGEDGPIGMGRLAYRGKLIYRCRYKDDAPVIMLDLVTGKYRTLLSGLSENVIIS